LDDGTIPVKLMCQRWFTYSNCLGCKSCGLKLSVWLTLPYNHPLALTGKISFHWRRFLSCWDEATGTTGCKGFPPPMLSGDLWLFKYSVVTKRTHPRS
jgi:hypothetical protein